MPRMTQDAGRLIHLSADPAANPDVQTRSTQGESIAERLQRRFLPRPALEENRVPLRGRHRQSLGKCRTLRHGEHALGEPRCIRHFARQLQIDAQRINRSNGQQPAGAAVTDVELQRHLGIGCCQHARLAMSEELEPQRRRRTAQVPGEDLAQQRSRAAKALSRPYIHHACESGALSLIEVGLAKARPCHVIQIGTPEVQDMALGQT